jgi:hypothetical protein
MASLQQCIDFLDRKCPDHGETDANVCSDLNDLHNDIFLQLYRLSNNVERYQASDTIADQLSYSLPSNARIEDILRIEVAIDTSDSEFEEYTYQGFMDYAGTGNYYGRDTATTFWLMKDGLPISTAGLTVMIYHYKRPTQFDSSDLSVIPELDADYHDLLKFGIVQLMYEQGAHPNTELADYWQRKFDEKMIKVKNAMQERYSNAPNITSQILGYM